MCPCTVNKCLISILNFWLCRDFGGQGVWCLISFLLLFFVLGKAFGFFSIPSPLFFFFFSSYFFKLRFAFVCHASLSRYWLRQNLLWCWAMRMEAHSWPLLASEPHGPAGMSPKESDEDVARAGALLVIQAGIIPLPLPGWDTLGCSAWRRLWRDLRAPSST